MTRPSAAAPGSRLLDPLSPAHQASVNNMALQTQGRLQPLSVRTAPSRMEKNCGGTHPLSPHSSPRYPRTSAASWAVLDVRAAYTFGRELGRGQFGVTYLATHKASGARRACKSAARKLAHASDAEDVRREVQIMHHLTGHRSIVELHGAYEDRHSVNLAMELCEGGEPVLPRLPARLGKSAEEDIQAVEARRPATTRDRSRHSSWRRSLRLPAAARWTRVYLIAFW
ncbi:hypothetical protein ACQ4PT_044068 [Festuca glaucescens]